MIAVYPYHQSSFAHHLAPEEVVAATGIELPEKAVDFHLRSPSILFHLVLAQTLWGIGKVENLTRLSILALSTIARYHNIQIKNHSRVLQSFMMENLHNRNHFVREAVAGNLVIVPSIAPGK